jgi:hypothetical protein
MMDVIMVDMRGYEKVAKLASLMAVLMVFVLVALSVD